MYICGGEKEEEKETLHSRLLDLTLQVCRGMLLVDELIVQLVNQHGVTRFSKLFIYKESQYKAAFSRLS